MRVTFVLPGLRGRPAGGFLVVYRYANELARRGHLVAVVHPRRIERAGTTLERAKAATWRLRKRLRGQSRPRWYALDKTVESLLVTDLRDEAMPDADAVFATACTTADAVIAFGRAKGTKLYLVQGYEDWLCGKAKVDATWRLPMHKVVSSGWLAQIGAELGEAQRITHIPYGVELDLFSMTTPPNERPRARVGLLAHPLPTKGTQIGVAALEQARGAFPELDAIAFGATARPPSLPEWVSYVENPSRRELAELYNSCSIFVHPSVSEGWGLTGAEALACGCALVVSDSGGVRDYAVDGETAIIVPPSDGDALAAAVVELVRDDARRTALATRGRDAIQRFTWTRAADSLEALLLGRLHT